MITIIPDSPNIAAANHVRPIVEQAYAEVRELLPELPANMNIWLDNWVLIPETGDGGYAYAPDTITIAFDMDFTDKEAQKRSLRATIFHEAFHLVQGHTHEKPHATYGTALDSAIYEGMATVFEREYAGSKPLWGIYATTDEQQLNSWQASLQNIPIDVFTANINLWQQWAFYDSEDNERWKLYKTGTWLVDRYLQVTAKDILSLRHTPASHILERNTVE